MVALHRRGGDATGALAAARALFGDRADLVAPQAARPCNPFQSNLRAAPGYEGFSWYLGDDIARPEAASFGDVLEQLDVFVSRLGRPFVLAGEGQGAVLAVTLALHAPEGLAGVHACPSALASIEGWSPPALDLDGIEFLLDVHSDGARALCALLTERRAGIVATSTSPRGGAGEWLESIHTSLRSRRLA